MKISRFLAVALLVTGCSVGSPTPDTDTSAPIQSEPTPEATVGEEPPSNARVAPPQTRVVAEKRARSDERAAAAGAVTQAAMAAGVNTDAAVLQDFKERVAQYVDLHKDAATGAAKPKETADPAEIVSTQEALAARIRAARSTAKQGDIFTAEIRHHFRKLLAPELKSEDGRDAKEIMKDDAPAAGSIPFKVNAKYPEGAPLPSLPANLLLSLPTLPQPLEYRIIGKHLVLLDTGAGIIVDYFPSAIG
jgi:hypothetical protein